MTHKIVFGSLVVGLLVITVVLQERFTSPSSSDELFHIQQVAHEFHPQSLTSPQQPQKTQMPEAPTATPLPSTQPTASPSPTPTPSPSAKQAEPLSVEKLHAQALVVDTHVETPLLMTEKKVKLAQNSGQIDLKKLQEGGVDVVFFSIFVHPRYRKIAKSHAEYMIKTLKKEVLLNEQKIEMAYSYKDIIRITQSDKIAALMGMEGGDPLMGKLENVSHFHKLGVRYLGPTWSLNTQLADSSGQRPQWKGLSPFGKQVVQEMDKLGMLVDVSHLSDASFWDVVKTSQNPIIATHSNARGQHPSSRNLNDDMLKNLASKGGVVGAVFYPPFLSKKPASVKDVVDHIDYMAKKIGVEHVGLGSDFDGLDRPPPQGLKDASDFPAITKELRARKYSDQDIEMILGGNFMRVFEQVLH